MTVTEKQILDSVQLRDLAETMPDRWVYDLSKERIQERVIDQICSELTIPYGIKIKTIDFELSYMYQEWFDYVHLSRIKEWTKKFPNHVVFVTFMGKEAIFIPDLNKELIDFVYKKTWDIEWWDAECKDYGCDTSRPGHKYLAFAIAIEMWFKKLYDTTVKEAFF